MSVIGIYSVRAPSVEEQAAYEARVREVGLREASFEFVQRHADRLMNGAPVGVVEVPVTDLDEWRERRRAS